MKIANDIRWLGSGPRCGLGELLLPANEPGSSIMPGKVNPTQCEALIMVCIAVIGADTAVGIAGSQGNFELNTVPAARHQRRSCTRPASSATPARRSASTASRASRRTAGAIAELLERSLMLVTALSPVIGYDRPRRSPTRPSSRA